jgi:hypothetical protein
MPRAGWYEITQVLYSPVAGEIVERFSYYGRKRATETLTIITNSWVRIGRRYVVDPTQLRPDHYRLIDIWVEPVSGQPALLPQPDPEGYA